MATYRKLQVIKFSTDFAEATKIVECPKSDPKPNEVLIRVHYCGVNATDVNSTAGRIFSAGLEPPFDIGLEALGVVEKHGKDVQGFAEGDPVFVCAWTGLPGYSEYIYCTADRLFKIPSVDPKYLPLIGCGLTAAPGLDIAGQVSTGKTVLVTAAAGGIGHLAVQWAKLKGCKVIGTCSSKSKADKLRSIGCDHVINYREEDLSEALSRDFPNGVDVIWETIGGKVTETLLGHIAVGGRMVIIGGTSNYKASGFPTLTIDIMKFFERTVTAFAFFNHSAKFPAYVQQLLEALDKNKQMTMLMDFGESAGDDFVGLESAKRAVEYLHAGKNCGKVMIKLR